MEKIINSIDLPIGGECILKKERGVTMLKISEFSTMSRITVKMLRNYDEIDLLKPAYIDESNGYRYYEEKQLVIANRILSLRHMGFSLPMIANILEEYKDQSSLHTYLQMQIKQIDEDIKRLQLRKSMIEHAIKLDEEENLKLLDVVVKQVPARNVIAYRTMIEDHHDEKDLWIKLHTYINEQHIQVQTPNYDTAVFYKMAEVNGCIDIEIQRAVLKLGESTEEFMFKQTPEKLVASYTYKGTYEDICDGIYLVNRWIYENDYEVTGPLFHLYYISPKTEKVESQFITEICIPIRSKE